MNKAFELFEKVRVEKDMGVRELATLAKVNEATYRNLAKGRSQETTANMLRSVAFALDLTMDEVFAYMDGGNPSPTTADLRKINQEPATTQELDTGISVLIRMMERNSEAYDATIRDLKEQFDDALTSKDSQFERERESYRSTIAATEKNLEESNEYLERFGKQIRRFSFITGFLVILCGIMMGIMLMMFTNNTALRSEVANLKEIVTAYADEDAAQQ